MRIALRLAAVTTALGVLTACDDVLLGYDGTFTGNCDRDPPLTYDNYGKAYLGKWCTGCHSSLVRENQRSGAPLGVNFETSQDIMAQVKEIDETEVQTDYMPPGGGASEAESEALGEWLRCQVYTDAQNQAGGT